MDAECVPWAAPWRSRADGGPLVRAKDGQPLTPGPAVAGSRSLVGRKPYMDDACRRPRRVCRCQTPSTPSACSASLKRQRGAARLLMCRHERTPAGRARRGRAAAAQRKRPGGEGAGAHRENLGHVAHRGPRGRGVGGVVGAGTRAGSGQEWAREPCARARPPGYSSSSGRSSWERWACTGRTGHAAEEGAGDGMRRERSLRGRRVTGARAPLACLGRAQDCARQQQLLLAMRCDAMWWPRAGAAGVCDVLTAGRGPRGSSGEAPRSAGQGRGAWGAPASVPQRLREPARRPCAAGAGTRDWSGKAHARPTATPSRRLGDGRCKMSTSVPPTAYALTDACVCRCCCCHAPNVSASTVFDA